MVKDRGWGLTITTRGVLRNGYTNVSAKPALRQPFGSALHAGATKSNQSDQAPTAALGLRIAQFSARAIHIWAYAYLEVHRRELIEQAMEMVSKSPELRKLYEREQRHRAKLNNSVQSKEPCSATTISI
jgi:hypothetical protein